MAVDVKNSSRLILGDLLLIDGFEFWDILDLPDFSSQPNDISYTVKDGDAIDDLANRFYQDHMLWWVIAWANGLELLPVDLIPNSVISIPNRDFVRNKLLKGLVKSISG